jgi:hypothetical protein
MGKNKKLKVEVLPAVRERLQISAPADDSEMVLRQVLEEEIWRAQREMEDALENNDARGAQLALIEKQTCQRIKQQLQTLKRQLSRSATEDNDESHDTWFKSRALSDELKGMQTVVERRKWATYFERYGCLRCRTTMRPHSGNGLCATCRVTTHQRLKAILKELEEESGR